VFGPHETYERSGDVSDVVSRRGWALRDDGDTLQRQGSLGEGVSDWSPVGARRQPRAEYGALNVPVQLPTTREADQLRETNEQCRERRVARSIFVIRATPSEVQVDDLDDVFGTHSVAECRYLSEGSMGLIGQAVSDQLSAEGVHNDHGLTN
jgi:hypothetical protein